MQNPTRTSLSEIARPAAAVAHPEDSLRAVVYRMAESGITRFPVTDRQTGTQLVGMISLEDLLGARTAQSLHEERTRERVLRVRMPFARRPAPQ